MRVPGLPDVFREPFPLGGVARLALRQESVKRHERCREARRAASSLGPQWRPQALSVDEDASQERDGCCDCPGR